MVKYKQKITYIVFFLLVTFTHSVQATLVREWFLAAREGEQEKLRDLLSSEKIDINTKDQYGWTALHFSAREGHLDCVQLLVEKGADIYAVNNVGATALVVSAADGHIDIVNYLQEEIRNC